MFDVLQQELAQRAEQGLLRSRRLLESAQGTRIRVDGLELLSFCSNDYLGLANHPALVAAARQAASDIGIGSGASHLITGHHYLHHKLEVALADFVGLPRALLFSSGYMANLGVLTSLLGRGDAVFADRLNHASLNDAAVLSRAELKRYPHNNMAALEQLLNTSKARQKIVVTDAVFSMDGDIAPVSNILKLCEQYDAWLMLDDAHGFGVLGNGQGSLAEHKVRSPRIIYMATLGKAAGVAGAFVAGEGTLIENLMQKARSYVYTTASPPLLAAALLASLVVIETESWRRKKLNDLIRYLHKELQPCSWHLTESVTPIQPLIIGTNKEALNLSERLLKKGILVPAIRPPTVPKGTARLRISLSAIHTEDDLAQLVSAIQNRDG